MTRAPTATLQPTCSTSLTDLTSGLGNVTAATERLCDDCEPQLSTEFKDTCRDPTSAISVGCLNSEGASLGTYCSFLLQPQNGPTLRETFFSIEL